MIENRPVASASPRRFMHHSFFVQTHLQFCLNWIPFIFSWASSNRSRFGLVKSSWRCQIASTWLLDDGSSSESRSWSRGFGALFSLRKTENRWNFFGMQGQIRITIEELYEFDFMPHWLFLSISMQQIRWWICNVTVFWPHLHCLKITKNVAFEFLTLAFSINCCLIEIDLSGNAVWP